MAKKAIVIDGNSLVYRVYWATSKMLDYYKQHNLTPTNAVNMFIRSILNMLKVDHYDYVYIAFDHAKHTFRSDMLDEYKANRKPMPQELLVQLPIINLMLDTLGIVHESREGFEGDDLVGSFCQLMNSQGVVTEVFSSDKDMLQLVNELTHVNLIKNGGKVDKHTVENFGQLYFGLTPSQVVDFKAIVGDGSDNFKGIKGIGPKSAANLLKKYGSFANIYNNLHELAEKQKQKFVECKADGELCFQIASIKRDLFVDKPIEDFIKKPADDEQFKKMCNEYELPGLLDHYLNTNHS